MAFGVDGAQLRRRWAGITGVLALATLIAGLLAVPTVLMKRHEAVLDRRGQRATAVVMTSSSAWLRWLPDEAEVVYEVDGTRYVAKLMVESDRQFPVGSKTQVVFDPRHPGHAKPVDGWSPSYRTLLIFALVVLGLGVVGSARRAVVTLLVRRAGRGSAVAHTLPAESFEVRRWWRRSERQWVAVWVPDADPLSAEPPLYVPVERLDTDAAVHPDRPATVVGTLAAGQWLMIFYGDRAVWPRGRARRDRPRGKVVAHD